MRNLTFNGDWTIATAAFAQFYDSFAWDNDTAEIQFGIKILALMALCGGQKQARTE